jgi:hypothetical protein
MLPELFFVLAITEGRNKRTDNSGGSTPRCFFDACCGAIEKESEGTKGISSMSVTGRVGFGRS